MVPQKRRRKILPSPALPVDLLLEIVARSDLVTLIRCAAVCKPLRRDILSVSFVRRVTQHGGIVPPSVVAYLHTRPMRNRNRVMGPLVSLVHPAATPAASCFVDNSLAPYVLRRSLDLLRRFDPLASRGGLVLLRRRPNINRTRESEFDTDLCVFNPMTGDRTYLPGPRGGYWCHRYILLTAEDGVGCSFLLVAADVELYNRNGGCSIKVQTFRSSSTHWDRATSNGHRRLPSGNLEHGREGVVLGGNIVHWLLSDVNKILTYDIRKEWLGSVKLPPTNGVKSQRILGTSTDGRLRLLTAEIFMISAWLQVADGWVKEAVIDVEQNLRSLLPSMSPDCMWIAFERFGERSRVVLFRVCHGDDMLLRPKGRLAVLDLDTREMHLQESHPSLLLEIDMSQHLQGMKMFS
ncbi:hypothetical protein ACQ4PT_015255 [Festuca glaucescens]